MRERVRSARCGIRSANSLVTDVRLVSHTIIGSALALNDEIIHLTAFREMRTTRAGNLIFTRGQAGGGHRLMNGDQMAVMRAIIN